MIYQNVKKSIKKYSWQQRTVPTILALEPRMLFDGAAVVTPEPASSSTSSSVTTTADATQSTTTSPVAETTESTSATDVATSSIDQADQTDQATNTAPIEILETSADTKQSPSLTDVADNAVVTEEKDSLTTESITTLSGTTTEKTEIIVASSIDSTEVTTTENKTIAEVIQGIDPAAGGYAKSTSDATEVVFIDHQVQYKDVLISGTRDGVDVYILGTESNPWEQMTGVISQMSGVQSVHIVSHGAEGDIVLNGTNYTAQTLQSESSYLQSWRSYLTDSADILVYGCDVATGQDGQLLISTLALVTQADVAASTDQTGATDLGGDWVLEAQTGAIESQIFASSDSLQLYQGDLATVTLSFASGSDSGTSGDRITNVLRPSFSFTSTGAFGSYVLTIDSVTQASVGTGGSNGSVFTFQVPSNLTDGSHTIVVTTWSNGSGGGSQTDTGTITFTVDSTAPTASVTAASILTSGNAVVRSTEVGTAYLVKDTVVVSNLSSITTAADNVWNSVAITTANTDTNLSASGLSSGSYKVYSIDAAGNLSSASSSTVTITAPNSAPVVDLNVGLKRPGICGGSNI